MLDNYVFLITPQTQRQWKREYLSELGSRVFSPIPSFIPEWRQAYSTLQKQPSSYKPFPSISYVEDIELACSKKSACPLPYGEKVLGNSTFSRTETRGLQKRKQKKKPKPFLEPLSCPKRKATPSEWIEYFHTRGSYCTSSWTTEGQGIGITIKSKCGKISLFSSHVRMSRLGKRKCTAQCNSARFLQSNQVQCSILRW